MFGSAIWDKLPECVFEHFESAQVTIAISKIFKNHIIDLSKKLLEPNM